MSRVTTHARSVVQELVDRRLWPVAVLLLAAVLAVPVLLGGGEEPAASAPVTEAQTAVAAGADDSAQITIVESTPPRRTRAGRVRNPFVQPTETQTADTAAETPSAPSAATATAGASSASAPGGVTTVSQGADTGGAGAASAGPQPAAPTKPTTPVRRVVQDDPRDDVFHVNLRFGTGPGNMRVAKDVARLTPLPSAADPLFVFLGVLKDGKTVVFLLPPGARAEGEGTCRPKARDCRLLEVRTDETQVVEVPGADGKRQFVVRVTGVKRSEAKTAARAAAAHARVSQAGQALLREADADKGTDPFDALRFRPDLGVLVRAPRRARAVAAGTRSGEVVVWRTRAARG